MAELDLQVIILAAGSGERLRPLTLQRPKALCPVCNIPLLQRILRDLQRDGFHSATLSFPQVAPEIERKAHSLVPPGFSLELVVAGPTILGSAAAAAAAFQPPATRALVIYGDSLLSTDFARIVETHERFARRGSKATIVYHSPPDLCDAETDGCTYHGVMAVDDDNRVERFIEKPKVETIESGFDLANAGVVVVERELLDFVAVGGLADFSRDVFQPLVSRHPAQVYGCSIDRGFRRDVGSLSRFYQLNMLGLQGELPVELPGVEVARSIRVGDGSSYPRSALLPPVLVGDRVILDDNTTLGPHTIIGNDCRIGAGTSIRESILLDGSEIGANCHIEACVLGWSTHLEDGTELPRGTVLAAGTMLKAVRWCC